MKGIYIFGISNLKSPLQKQIKISLIKTWIYFATQPELINKNREKKRALNFPTFSNIHKTQYYELNVTLNKNKES